MKVKKICALLLALLMSLSLIACGDKSGSDNGLSGITSSDTTQSGTVETVAYCSVEKETVEEQTSLDAESLRQTISDEFSIVSDTSNGYQTDGTTYTITKEGEYTLSGVLSGNVVVDAEDAKVEIILSGCQITSNQSAPITVLNADEVSISAQENTFNEILDQRSTRTEDTEEDLTAENAGAAIYSSCDLTVKGHGALVVVGNYNNGIASKDDLEIKNLTLKVTASNNAIKGNDSVQIEDAQLIVISTAGDGIKTENSTVTDKGNQKGSISISGGTVNVYAACDGISAAYDVVLSGDGYLGIYTDSYSGYSQEGVDSGSTEFYMILSTSDYNESYDYYAFYNNGEDATGKFIKSESSISVSSGMSRYYGLLINAPSGYDHVVLCAYEKGETPGEQNYVLCSENMNINSVQNAFLLSISSDGVVDGDWVSLTTSSSSKSGQTYSTKGIKADNTISVEGDITIVIQSTDDAIHVNGGDTLENGNTGSGDFLMNGGTLQLTTLDDGVHADATLTINQGILIITTSYEGLEAGQITINGGRTYAYATDDAVNGSTSAGNTSATVTVNGGYLEVETPSGDTDAIDVNGNYIQNGGFVFVKGGSTMGSMAGSVDVDGSITVDGGCIIACGGVCEGPEGDANAYISSGTSMSSGEYTLQDSSGQVICTFTLNNSFSGVWIACDDLKTDSEYTLYKDGSSVLSWTQEAGTMGTANGFGGGFGNPFGGNQGGPGRK